MKKNDDKELILTPDDKQFLLHSNNPDIFTNFPENWHP